jgi:Bacterial Ig-like domain (group 3)
MRVARRFRIAAVAVFAVAFGANGATGVAATSPQPVLKTVPGTIEYFAVSCPTVTWCLAGGSTNTTQHDGLGFIEAIRDGKPGAVVPIQNTDEIGSLSCPTATFCEAIADSLTTGSNLVTITNGKLGAFVPAPAGDGFAAVSCSTKQLCEAVGQGRPSDVYHDVPILGPVHGGKLGHVSSVNDAVGLGSGFSAVSCVAGFKCTAVGQGVYGPQNNQVKSIAVDTAAGKPGPAHFKSGMALGTVSCYRSLATCWAAGDEASALAGLVARVTNGAIGSAKDIKGSHEALAISCFAATQCELAANERTDPTQEATIAVTTPVTDGTAGTLTPYDVSWFLNAISCPVAGLCTSVGVTSVTPSAIGVVVSTEFTPRKAKLELRASPTIAHAPSKKVVLTFEVKHLNGQPSPTGSVSFEVGTTTLCAAAALVKDGGNAKAICKTRASQIGRGKHSIVATYGGDLAYQAGTAKTTFSLTKT